MAYKRADFFSVSVVALLLGVSSVRGQGWSYSDLAGELSFNYSLPTSNSTQFKVPNVSGLPTVGADIGRSDPNGTSYVHWGLDEDDPAVDLTILGHGYNAGEQALCAASVDQPNPGDAYYYNIFFNDSGSSQPTRSLEEVAARVNDYVRGLSQPTLVSPEFTLNGIADEAIFENPYPDDLLLISYDPASAVLHLSTPSPSSDESTYGQRFDRLLFITNQLSPSLVIPPASKEVTATVPSFEVYFLTAGNADVAFGDTNNPTLTRDALRAIPGGIGQRSEFQVDMQAVWGAGNHENLAVLLADYAVGHGGNRLDANSPVNLSGIPVELSVFISE